jgi:hypothetical protein
MKTSIFVKALLAGAVASSLSACKLEDYVIERMDQVSNDDIAYVASGVITKVDGLTVNGIEFQTDGTQVVVDDQNGTQDQLDVGMYVTVEGSLNSDGKSGSASKIIFENEVEGMVEANNVALDGTLKVMGQTVIVDDKTRFHSELVAVSSIADIKANQFVEVSGYSDGKGNIRATRIEVKADTYLAGTQVEIKGTVSQLSDTSFYIGDMEIAHSDAYLKDFNGKPLSEGQRVEVKSVNLPDGTYFAANEIQLEDSSHDSHGAKLEGIVGQVNDTSFTLNGDTVYLDGNTFFEYGALNNLVAGSKIEVEGSYDSDGKFIANQVEFDSDSQESELKDDSSDSSVEAYDHEGEEDHEEDRD